MQFDGSSLAIEINPDLILLLEIWQFGSGLLLLAAGFGTLILAKMYPRRTAPIRETETWVPSIDVESLEATGPNPSGPRLEIYGTPVRVAVVVLAPVGRDSEMPRHEEVPRILEQLIPRLSGVTEFQSPDVHIWPEQLSSQGFTNSFFNNVALPGERGKGTPWCSVAGKFTAAARQYLIGLVCCGEQENGLAQLVIEHEGRWNDVLRVKS